MLPSTILHGYYYRYKTRLQKENILAVAKAIKDDPLGEVAKAKKQRQVYCVTKRKFFATASPAELTKELVFYDGQDQDEKDELHRILQFRLR
jgi:hypothetical protein